MADPIDRLVGIPFRDHGRTIEGADCWGLVRLALIDAAGLELPSYEDDYASAIERRANAELIKGEVGEWYKVLAGQERRLDSILMSDGRYDCHIGLVVQRGRMLHTYQGGAACIDRYDYSPFKERIVGFYRHRSFAE